MMLPELQMKNKLNKLLIFVILAVASLSLLFSLTSANAEIKLTPPLNWQPAPNNNSTAVKLLQNSTKSVFEIIKAPNELSFPLLSLGPMVAQAIADEGLLEYADQISFGHSNYGYRYFINLSSPSQLLNSSNPLINKHGLLSQLSQDYDVPFKGMLILTEKKGDLYAIIFLSPHAKFDSVYNQIKPMLDSIELSNSTSLA